MLIPDHTKIPDDRPKPRRAVIWNDRPMKVDPAFDDPEGVPLLPHPEFDGPEWWRTHPDLFDPHGNRIMPGQRLRLPDDTMQKIKDALQRLRDDAREQEKREEN